MRAIFSALKKALFILIKCKCNCLSSRVKMLWMFSSHGSYICCIYTSITEREIACVCFQYIFIWKWIHHSIIIFGLWERTKKKCCRFIQIFPRVFQWKYIKKIFKFQFFVFALLLLLFSNKHLYIVKEWIDMNQCWKQFTLNWFSVESFCEDVKTVYCTNELKLKLE